ncbi:MAG: hypothetical protein GWP10_03560 [Nitrospiraceae bacterium]|nr:hypothetical protein [Nitrospiraceae bacterium]
MVKKITSLKLIDKIALPNDLVLELYDYSRRVAGDRWLVGLLSRISIEVSKENFANVAQDQGLYKEFIRKQGQPIYFEMKKERNFIDQREKDQVFKQLLDELRQHALSYMGHKSFAKGFIRQKVRDFEERQKWWK